MDSPACVMRELCLSVRQFILLAGAIINDFWGLCQRDQHVIFRALRKFGVLVGSDLSVPFKVYVLIRDVIGLVQVGDQRTAVAVILLAAQLHARNAVNLYGVFAAQEAEQRQICLDCDVYDVGGKAPKRDGKGKNE